MIRDFCGVVRFLFVFSLFLGGRVYWFCLFMEDYGLKVDMKVQALNKFQMFISERPHEDRNLYLLCLSLILSEMFENKLPRVSLCPSK